MPNSLTGDFEAVLQVSGGTINRLVASMHQNAFENPKLPSFPHTVRMRIGDDYAYEGVRGRAHVQVSVPRIELFHGVTDRFILDVGVRAWYRPDPGTEPLPAFINGTVRAEYRVQDIDPSCPGWEKNAADHLWVRVIRDSVTFRGTVENDESIFELAGAGSDPAASIAKVTRQIAHLLARRFEATPHPVSKRFRRGSLRSLNAPTGGSAVALPLALGGEPVGQITSIDTVLVANRDLAIAVSVEYVMSQAMPLLEMLASLPKIYVGDAVVYQIALAEPPTIKWQPQGTWAILELFAKGSAKPDIAVLPDVTVEIVQRATLGFDGEKFHLDPLSPSVTVEPSGGYSTAFFGVVDVGLTALHAFDVTDIDSLRAHLRNQLSAVVSNLVNGALASVALPDIGVQAQGLAQQLATLDDKVHVWVDTAEFVADGLILRGTIGLAPRRAIVVKAEKTAAEDAHSALESWIPGGRIDRFDWSWNWFGSGEPGAETHRDRFLLRRPSAGMGRWGMALGNRPLPGLDGWGTVCLKITGAQVDPVTGQLVTVISSRRCTRFGFAAAEPFTEVGRLFLRDMPELSQDVPFPQLKDLPVVAARRGADGARSNTLLIYVDQAWDRETANTLAEGLGACGRYDAGLAALVLFREGILQAAGPGLVMDIERKMRELGIPGHVNEDVHGGWAQTLELRAGTGEPGWAIITPDGTTPWKQRGRVAPQELSSALDEFLSRCPDVRPVPYHPGIEVGQAIPATALHPGIRELVELPCPPPPLFDRLGVKPKRTVVTFVQKDSSASANHLRRLAGQYGQEEGEQSSKVVVVIDRANPRETESLKNDLGLDFVMLADPTGKITDRFRVGVWPTTITLDGHGIVSEVQLGVAGRARDDRTDKEFPYQGHSAL
jgi:hypothetical protein